MNYNIWINKFMKSWQNKDIESIMESLAKDCKYYETVFNEPCKNFEEIRKLWEIVPKNQKDITYDYKILLENENLCIVNFHVKRTLVPSEIVQNIDGIFQISLDKNNLCNFFKQRRSVKEE